MCKSGFETEGAWWHRIIFHGHDLLSYDYLDVGKTDRERIHYGARHYSNERIKISHTSKRRISIRCQHRTFSFQPLSKVHTVLRQLLTTLEILSKQLRPELRSYNAVPSTASMTSNWLNRAKCSCNFNPTMAVRAKIYLYIRELIPHKHRKDFFVTIYVQDTKEIEISTIRGSNAGQYLNQSILVLLGLAISQGNPYARGFQCLRSRAQRESPDIYTMVSHADEGPSTEYTRIYNATEYSQVAAINTEVENRELGTRDIFLPTRGLSTVTKIKLCRIILLVTALTIRCAWCYCAKWQRRMVSTTGDRI